MMPKIRNEILEKSFIYILFRWHICGIVWYSIKGDEGME